MTRLGPEGRPVHQLAHRVPASRSPAEGLFGAFQRIFRDCALLTGLSPFSPVTQQEAQRRPVPGQEKSRAGFQHPGEIELTAKRVRLMGRRVAVRVAGKQGR